MPTRLALRVLCLLLALSLLPLAFARATHSPTSEQVVAVAESPASGMDCYDAGGYQQCDPALRTTPPRSAQITPALGPLAKVVTVVQAYADGPYFIDPSERSWIGLVQTPGCADSAGIDLFITDMLKYFYDTGGLTYGPVTVGECSMVGSVTLSDPQYGGCQPPNCFYWVTGTLLPSAFPTPAPTPTPPVPVVTPAPTATPTPSPTPSPTPTPTSRPTATASPTRTPRPSASASVSPTPEQTVAGITFAPEPSLPPPDIAGDPTGWAASVHDPADVSTDPAAMGVSALLAVLLLLFMGFVGELFNNTVKANYDEISGWWKKGLLGRLAAAWSAIWKAGA